MQAARVAMTHLKHTRCSTAVCFLGLILSIIMVIAEELDGDCRKTLQRLFRDWACRDCLEIGQRLLGD